MQNARQYPSFERNPSNVLEIGELAANLGKLWWSLAFAKRFSLGFHLLAARFQLVGNRRPMHNGVSDRIYAMRWSEARFGIVLNTALILFREVYLKGGVFVNYFCTSRRGGTA